MVTKARTLGSAVSVGGVIQRDGAVKYYSTVNELPLSGNTIGDTAYISNFSRLYIWTGSGWYNIALINTNPSFDSGGEPESSYLLELNDSGYISPLTITLLATDPEGIPIQYSALLSDSASNFVTVSQDSSIFTITPKSVDSIGEFDSFGGEFSITFRASDGVNLAIVLSEFTVDLRTVIENSRYTTLMLKTNGIDAANNNTFVDGSVNNFTITRNGNTTQGSFSPYGDKWGNYFDGAGDYLAVPATTEFALGTQDFCIETWYYPVSKVTFYPRIVHSGPASWTQSDVWALHDRHNEFPTKFSWACYNFSTSGNLLVSSTVVQNNSWYHLAVTRSGNTFRLFVNGVIEDTYTNSGACTTSSTVPLTIGRHPVTDQNDSELNGYISDIRFVKGSAIYTSNFTPPIEPLTAVAGTSLLTCQSNRFKDNSVNNFTLTKSGDVKVTKFSPYDQSAYNASTLGGSAYFDGTGTGDSLSVPAQTALSFGTGDFTIEGWIYLAATPAAYAGFIDSRGVSGDAYAFGIINSSGLKLDFFYGAGRVTSTSTVAINQWVYCAVTRSSGTIRLFINGVLDSATVLYTPAINANRAAPLIGQLIDPHSFSGLISDLRVIKGTAIYTSSFTPPTEPLAAVANTSLLCNFTNAGIFDASTKSVLEIETVGNAQVDTAVTKFGTGGSMYFDGTGDYLTTSATPTFLLPGTGDTTFECWIQTTSSGDMAIFSNFDANSPFNGVEFGVNNGYQTFWSQGTFINRPTGSTGVSTLKDGGWHHLAWVITNSGTSLSTYVDGVLNYAASITPSTTGKSTQSIGSDSNTARGRYFNGYIEDLRITKGLARYTSNFTPPLAPLEG
jgi:hypothetical protein